MASHVVLYYANRCQFSNHRLIKKHVEQGYRPIIVCSAMGKTTNTLLSAGDFALKGQVIVESLRTMHVGTARTLGLPDSTIDSLNALLDSLERLLEGVSYIGELTPRTSDALVSFGERLSIRIVSSQLNKLGIPAQPFDAWTIGVQTTSEFGNAEVRAVLSEAPQISEAMLSSFLTDP